MNNEILINETNFKKFSKRLLKEIKAIDNKAINLSETHNILSRVLNKKDYNDMKKNLNNQIKEETIKSDIFNETIFFKEFLKDKNNLVIAELTNGTCYLNTFFYKNDFKNDVLENSGSVDYDLINKINIKTGAEELARFLRRITSNLYQNNISFNFECDIDSFINLNDNGDFCEYKINTNVNPFIKKELFYNSLYIKSSYSEKKE